MISSSIPVVILAKPAALSSWIFLRTGQVLPKYHLEGWDRIQQEVHLFDGGMPGQDDQDPEEVDGLESTFFFCFFLWEL